MVRITIGNEKYSLPTTWEEVEIEKILDCTTPKEYISVLGNIPYYIISKLTENQLFSLYQIVHFIDDDESLDGIIIDIPCTIKDENGDDGSIVELSAWQKLDEAKRCLSVKLFKTFYKLSKLYYPEEKKTVQQLSRGYKLLEQINLFLSHYEEMFNDPYEADEIAAGVEDMNGFGIFGTAYNLAGKDLLKVDHVLNLPAITVYTALFYSYKERKYMERLMEIKNPKK